MTGPRGWRWVARLRDAYRAWCGAPVAEIGHGGSATGVTFYGRVVVRGDNVVMKGCRITGRGGEAS